MGKVSQLLIIFFIASFVFIVKLSTQTFFSRWHVEAQPYKALVVLPCQSLTAFCAWRRRENFINIVLSSRVYIGCVPPGEGIRFRQLLSPSPSCSGTLNCLLANPVRTRHGTLVESDLRMTCVSLLAYILSLRCLRATGLVRRQAETHSARRNIPDIAARASQR